MPIYKLTEGNHVLGAGYFMFKRQGNSHYEYLAQTPNFNINVEVEKIELEGSDKPVAEVIESVISRIMRAAQTSFRQIDEDTLALFFAGTKSTETDAGASYTERISSAVVGGYYDLGDQTATSPAFGFRNVTNVVVTQDPDGTPVVLTEDTDYEVDTAEGVVKILAGGAVTDGDVLDIDFDTVASTTEVVTTGSAASIEGALKFISDNTRGDNRTYFFPEVELGPSGDFALKSRDTWQEIPVDIEILDPDGDTEACYILSEAVAT